MPFRSAKCRQFYHQDTVLLPKSNRRSYSGQSTPPTSMKKQSFSFLKASCAAVSPLLHDWWALPTLLERKRYPDQRSDTHAPTRMLGSRFWSINFSSAQLCSGGIGQLSTCANWCRVLCQSHFHQS